MLELLSVLVIPPIAGFGSPGSTWSWVRNPHTPDRPEEWFFGEIAWSEGHQCWTLPDGPHAGVTESFMRQDPSLNGEVVRHLMFVAMVAATPPNRVARRRKGRHSRRSLRHALPDVREILFLTAADEADEEAMNPPE